jgi:hypothetical protein
MSLTSLEKMQPKVDPKVLSFLRKHFWGPRIPRVRISRKKVMTTKKPKTGPAIPFVVRTRQ